MVDDLYSDAPQLELVERARGVAVEGRPRLLVNLGLERGLQRSVGIVGSKEVRVADEETLLVVVGVDEPAGDAIRAIAAHLTHIGIEDIHTPYPHPYLPTLHGAEDYIGLSEENEQIALAGVLE